MKRNSALLFTIIMLLLFTSCAKEPVIDPQTKKEMEEPERYTLSYLLELKTPDKMPKDILYADVTDGTWSRMNAEAEKIGGLKLKRNKERHNFYIIAPDGSAIVQTKSGSWAVASAPRDGVYRFQSPFDIDNEVTNALRTEKGMEISLEVASTLDSRISSFTKVIAMDEGEAESYIEATIDDGWKMDASGILVKSEGGRAYSMTCSFTVNALTCRVQVSYDAK